MAQKDPLDWLEKVFIYDLSRPDLLNRPTTVTPISPEDILDPSFYKSLFEKTRALSIELGRREFAQHKGYQIEEWRGGDFEYYKKDGVYVYPSKEMAEEFSRFLGERHIEHTKALDYNGFWLKRRLSMPELKEISLVPYVLEVEMYVQYNDTPVVDVWIDGEDHKTSE